MARKSASPRHKRAQDLADASRSAPDPDDAEYRPRKRGRPRKSDANNTPKPAAPGQKKRGRPRKSDVDPAAAAAKKRASLDSNGNPLPKRKRGRPSFAEVRERERLAAQNARHDDNEEEETTEQPSRRISGGSSSQPARRDSTRLDAADKPSAPYPHVFTTTRSVKQDTIDKRWAPLTPASVAAASETLTLAHRPIMQRLAATGQKRQYASSALSLLHRRISRKLQRGMPFPPAAVTGPASASQGPPVKRGRGRPRGIASNKTAGVEAEMDFESVLDGSQALERQLDPLLHAVELLRREKEHMERELELDYQNLRNLEAGARGQARVQRDQIKKAHALVPEAKPRAADDDVEMVFDTKGVPPGGVFKDLDDPELKKLALQLGDHVDSMTTNLQQVGDVPAQLAETKTALRNVLLRHLDAKQYDEVVLG